MLMAAVTCVGFASCSNDEDEAGNEDSSASIVGSWKCSWGSEDYSIATFMENGSGVVIEYEPEDDGEYRKYYDYFHWGMGGQTLYIEWDEGGRETYKDVIVTETKLYWNLDGPTIWYRQ